MNLPFTPTSFRKLDILQQLMEYESQKNEKSLWNGVKAVLIWAASQHHQHLGSSIDSNHVKDALAYCVGEKFISEEERKRLVYSCRYILESLPVYGFGDQEPTTDPKKPRVKINRNGVLAGRILVETHFLENTWWRYNFWIIIWWIVLGAAAIILISQALTATMNIFNTVTPTHNGRTDYRVLPLKPSHNHRLYIKR